MKKVLRYLLVSCLLLFAASASAQSKGKHKLKSEDHGRRAAKEKKEKRNHPLNKEQIESTNKTQARKNKKRMKKAQR